MASGEEVEVGRHRVRVKRKIGEGGFAFIYICEDANTSGELVLKKTLLQSREQRDICEKEVSLLKRLRHPNIVTLIDAEVNAKSGLLLLEFCPGGHLLAILNTRNGRPPPIEDTLRIFADVVEAVRHLHGHDVAHRDLKLENVLRGNGSGIEARYKICDFGSAVEGPVPLTTAQERANEEERIEKTTTLMYRAPEMVELYLAPQLDTKVDIWALGCVLYATAYLKHPINADSKLGILNARVVFPDAATNTSPAAAATRELITRMLTQDPAARPDITEVFDCLSAAREGRPLPPRLWQPPQPAESAENTRSMGTKRGSRRRNSLSSDQTAVAAAAAAAFPLASPVASAALNPNSVAARRLAAAHGGAGGGGGGGGGGNGGGGGVGGGGGGAGSLLEDSWGSVVTPSSDPAPAPAPIEWGAPPPAAQQQVTAVEAADFSGEWATFGSMPPVAFDPAALDNFAAFSPTDAIIGANASGLGDSSSAGHGGGLLDFGVAAAAGTATDDITRSNGSGSCHSTMIQSNNGHSGGGGTSGSSGAGSCRNSNGGLLDFAALPVGTAGTPPQQPPQPQGAGNLNELAAALRGVNVNGWSNSSAGGSKSSGMGQNISNSAPAAFRSAPGTLNIDVWGAEPGSGSGGGNLGSSGGRSAFASSSGGGCGGAHVRRGNDNSNAAAAAFNSPAQASQARSGFDAAGVMGGGGSERPQSLPMRSMARCGGGGGGGGGPMAATGSHSARLALALAAAGGDGPPPQWATTSTNMSTPGSGQASWPQQQLPPQQQFKGARGGVAVRPLTGDATGFGTTWPAPQQHGTGGGWQSGSGSGGSGGAASSPVAWGMTAPPPPPSSPAMGVGSPLGVMAGPGGALNMRALGGIIGGPPQPPQPPQQQWQAWPPTPQPPPQHGW